MSGSSSPAKPVIYWHRELPPLEAAVIGSHTIEATSQRVSGILSHRNDLWCICYDNLMTQATTRLKQEVARLGGRYAHVFDEAIDSRHDDATGEAWLHGRFDYMLYGDPPPSAQSGKDRP